MAMYDDKKIQNLVKKMTKQPKPKTEFAKVYDKTLTMALSALRSRQIIGGWHVILFRWNALGGPRTSVAD